ncbi:MAG: hypothetical protein IJ880_02550 [Bacilli bacterium]|nr:hypothetical protein [Bacilli bacterium]
MAKKNKNQTAGSEVNLAGMKALLESMNAIDSRFFGKQFHTYEIVGNDIVDDAGETVFSKSETQETQKPEKPAEQKPVKPEKPAEIAKPVEAEKSVEKQETPTPAENTEKPAEPEKLVVPQMIVKEGQRKLSKAERKALKKKQKMEKAEKKASSTEAAPATATDKVKEAVAEGVETGEFNVVHTNPYIELIQSKVKSWDSQGNALDENGAVILDSNGNIVKVDPVAGVILMAMPQQQSA